MKNENYHDPRSKLSHSLTEGTVYVDDRTDEQYRLAFVDDDVVVLKSLTDDHSTLTPREQFEANVGAGRFSRASGADCDGGAVSSGPVQTLQSLRDDYAETDGRTATHKASALQEAIDLLQSDGQTDDNETVDFESVDGIGAGTASNLRSAGYTVKGDIRSADDDELLEIGGVGEGNLSNLREQIS